MSKPEQVLIIEPQHELKFKGPFQQGNTTYMKLTNPSNDKVIFKIKTTAPKQYCVRPNSGMLEPNAKVDIAITPQAVYFDPDEKKKHKFMVQTVIAPEGKTNIDQLWKEINPDQLMDSKLRCVFEMPPAATTNATGAIAAEETVKKVTVVENTKTSTPIKDNFQQSENTEYEKQKAILEIKQLREEDSKLRHEILQLKEEILSLRDSAGGDGIGRSVSGSPHMYSPPEKMNHVMMMPMILAAVGVAILGMVIGKFLM